jgi:hypothetical protein
MAICILLMVPIQARAAKTREFLFESKSIPLEWNVQYEGWVSPGCHHEEKCEALRLLPLIQKANLVLKPVDLEGGKNPGSVLCRKLSGKVIFGAPKAGGGRTSFCQAGDGSLIPSSFLQRAYGGATR